MATLTAANSIYMLSITGLYPVPQQLQGYAADEAFGTDSVEPAEVVIGVDGKLSAGYTPYLLKQNIAIQADSPSLRIFEDWLAASNAAKEIYICNATIVLPAIGRKYVMSRGVLSGATPIPDVKKILQPVKYSITWERCDPANV